MHFRGHARAAGDVHGAVARYLRTVEHVTRGLMGIVGTVAVFFVAGGIGSLVGGGAGLVVASVWVLFLGTYCVLNFWHCREPHCVVTGWGWTSLAVLGLLVAALPGPVLPWFGVDVVSSAFLAILAAGYGLECWVLRRRGSRGEG